MQNPPNQSLFRSFSANDWNQLEHPFLTQLFKTFNFLSLSNVSSNAEKIRNGKPVTIFQVTQTDDSEILGLAYDESLASQDKDLLMDTQIMEATGSANSDVGLQLLLNVGNAIVSAKADRSKMATQLNAVAQSMQALGPQDEYEGQLIAQLIVLHEQAMDWLGRAQGTERADFANIYLNGASKLLTRHHETLEALLKYRRKGEQRAHVEHVHVHGGG